MATCSEVACPSAQRSLTSSVSPWGSTVARSTAPATTNVSSKPAATACSTAQLTTGRPRKSASSLWPAPPDPVNRLPPPAASTTAAVVNRSVPIDGEHRPGAGEPLELDLPHRAELELAGPV